MAFDPFDEQWWQGSEELNWWHSALASPPQWLPDPDEALAFLNRNRIQMLHALTLIRSMRTVESSQLHDLDRMLPARPQSALYLSMAAMRLIDMGFPARVDGRATSNPYTSGFTAFRLPRYRPVDRKRLAVEFGWNPMEIAGLGSGPLSAARQADRHNLITATIAVRARDAGWLTAGEAWCRFDRITLDPLMGGGGPDLAMIGGDRIVFIELTASTNRTLEAKFRRWDRVLDHPGCERMHVVWLEAGRGDNTGTIRNRLRGFCEDRPRQHAGVARDWRTDDFACLDGFAPRSNHPVEPSGWVRDDLKQIGRMIGFPNAGSWRLPERFEDRWIG
ncbi:hypothetical protein [Bifidobacterium sp. SO1]|uniref:hypothetical protein n=1 Tax=Bifidobacterium sp. SO1 TaxID=2809029 RepID=UPI001BDD7868|nr:hypothetical protein [Bifidobacterium sp. SO1]MBT1162737.1 hypothetical protein [Bifidobacterium sp. SO1]